MKRDLHLLANQRYDLLVIGGGIYGACVAWDAALRGLSVALVDQGDFGQATSANSMKTIHGGLRYLQDGNLALMRAMIKERRTWLQIAPHFIHPLPFLIPTYPQPTKSRLALRLALKANDLVGYDRNQLSDTQKHLSAGRTLSRSACLKLAPGLTGQPITGGAIWYDAQIYNSERLLLSIILSAVEAGAVAANYVQVTNLIRHGQNVVAAAVSDCLTGQPFEIRADMIANCAGAWIDSVLDTLPGRSAEPAITLSTAVNLVTRQILPDYALGVNVLVQNPAEARSEAESAKPQMIFMVPWREFSIIGTLHQPYQGHPDHYQLGERLIDNFMKAVNQAYPPAALTQEDIYQVHTGFLPMVGGSKSSKAVKLVRQSRIIDHALRDGIGGLVSISGVKYTTARQTAEQAVNLICKKMDGKARPCQTNVQPIVGGKISDFEAFVTEAVAEHSASIKKQTIRRLVHNYGSNYREILHYQTERSSWSQPLVAGSNVLKAEVIHAVRQEMAHKLTDVVQRRIELGAAGLPDETVLNSCATLMAAELGWDQQRQAREIETARAAYQLPWSIVKEKAGVL